MVINGKLRTCSMEIITLTYTEVTILTKTQENKISKNENMYETVYFP